MHANRLKSYVSRSDETEPVKHDNLYFVERIISAKRVKGKPMYLIKWRGYKEKTWEPLDNLPSWMVQEYHVTHTVQGKPRKRGLRL